jgi:hypothetical protein
MFFDHPLIGLKQFIGCSRSGVQYDGLCRKSAGCDRSETGQRLVDCADAVVGYQDHRVSQSLGKIGIGHRPADG